VCTGQFGLGFNSSYSIAETPVLISGSTFQILDPFEKYLPGNQPGGRVDLRMQNEVVVQELLNSLKTPLESVLDACDAKFVDGELDGTLFMLPLRTKPQAKKSDLYKIYCGFPVHLSGMFEQSPDRKMLHVDSYKNWNKLIVTEVLAPRLCKFYSLVVEEME
jgi:hypothetical protein